MAHPQLLPLVRLPSAGTLVQMRFLSTLNDVSINIDAVSCLQQWYAECHRRSRVFPHVSPYVKWAALPCRFLNWQEACFTVALSGDVPEQCLLPCGAGGLTCCSRDSLPRINLNAFDLQKWDGRSRSFDSMYSESNSSLQKIEAQLTLAVVNQAGMLYRYRLMDLIKGQSPFAMIEKESSLVI